MTTQKTKDEQPLICVSCGNGPEVGIFLWNSSIAKNFKHLELTEGMHLECYIDFLVDRSIKEKTNHE